MRAHALAVAWAAGSLAVGLTNPLGGLGLSGGGAIALAILLLAGFLWTSEAVPLFVTSFLVLGLNLVWLRPALEAAGQAVAADAFLAPFFSDLVLLFLGGFVLASALNRYRLDATLAGAILRRAGRRVPAVMGALMAVTATLSMWLSNTAATALMLGLCLPLAKSIADPGPRKALLLSVPLAANVGGLGTPIGTPPNAIVLEYLEGAGHPIGFAMWMVIGLPAVLLLLVLLWAALLRLQGGWSASLPLDAGADGQAASTDPDEAPWGRRLVLGVTAITILGWLLGGLVGLSPGTVSVLPVVAFFGARVLSVADFRALSWDVLFLMGGGLCLARSLELSGLADWLVAGVPTEGVPAWALASAFLVVACAMSTVMSNTATANLLAPLVAGLSGVSTAPVFLSVAFGCSVAMALPISTPPNAMAFASGQLEARDLLRVGLLATVAGVALTVVVFFRWWDLLGVS
ncbi:MAG: SLC13 family permease [Sandaracinaceae bacterium]